MIKNYPIFIFHHEPPWNGWVIHDVCLQNVSNFIDKAVENRKINMYDFSFFARIII